MSLKVASFIALWVAVCVIAKILSGAMHEAGFIFHAKLLADFPTFFIGLFTGLALADRK